MKNEFKFCPECGSRNIKHYPGNGATEENPFTKKWTCPDCGFDLYCNVAAACGAVIFDDDNNVLFEVRAKEPRKGYIVIPGGFIDANEKAETAVVRECMEETGLEVPPESVRFLCTNPNTYEYRNIVYKTCDIFFSVKLPEGQKVPDLVSKIRAQESEVAGICIHRILSEKDVDDLPLAFPSAVGALKLWLKQNPAK